MGVAAGAALGAALAQRVPLKKLLERLASPPPPAAPTASDRFLELAVERLFDTVQPERAEPENPPPAPEVEYPDPFDYVHAEVPQSGPPIINEPQLDPWFRPVDPVDLPDSIIGEETDWEPDTEETRFMLPDGSSVSAEQYMRDVES